ncbi:hypothetical protein LDL08_26010 [Nonomuraea glycinis]|uniref:Uncharacterized protein n=1 Tax=Nonomuraea glycinis TaxID=2047744 RepID=A0A918EAE7_9ACTN|nr:hypothetical protein [Nonomuraea glycinis]MCA2179641.1 hypothetical protein [Nonomuraea glycinis]GGP15253.1 hypothetical protein GCM10012278_74260 [Nonomuraea glycinis]
MTEGLPPHMRQLVEVAAIVAAAGATADWLCHLRGDMCALRVIKGGIASVPVMIPADPDCDPELFREAVKRLEAVVERMGR